VTDESALHARHDQLQQAYEDARQDLLAKRELPRDNPERVEAERLWDKAQRDLKEEREHWRNIGVAVTDRDHPGWREDHGGLGLRVDHNDGSVVAGREG